MKGLYLLMIEYRIALMKSNIGLLNGNGHLTVCLRVCVCLCMCAPTQQRGVFHVNVTSEMGRL